MLDFVEQYYILFIIISVLLIFSFIGYFVNEKNKKGNSFRINDNNNDNLNIKSDVSNTNIANNIADNMSINDIINKNVDSKINTNNNN